MKLTPKLESFLTDQFMTYSFEMGFKDIPMILYRDEELGGIVNNRKEFESIRNGALGESWHHKDTGWDYDVVYINVDNSDFLWQIVDTVVHELVHLKYPKLKHGNKFQEKVNSIMMGK